MLKEQERGDFKKCLSKDFITDNDIQQLKDNYQRFNPIWSHQQKRWLPFEQVLLILARSHKEDAINNNLLESLREQVIQPDDVFTKLIHWDVRDESNDPYQTIKELFSENTLPPITQIDDLITAAQTYLPNCLSDKTHFINSEECGKHNLDVFINQLVNGTPTYLGDLGLLSLETLEVHRQLLEDNRSMIRMQLLLVTQINDDLRRKLCDQINIDDLNWLKKQSEPIFQEVMKLLCHQGSKYCHLIDMDFLIENTDYYGTSIETLDDLKQLSDDFRNEKFQNNTTIDHIILLKLFNNNSNEALFEIIKHLDLRHPSDWLIQAFISKKDCPNWSKIQEKLCLNEHVHPKLRDKVLWNKHVMQNRSYLGNLKNITVANLENLFSIIPANDMESGLYLFMCSTNKRAFDHYCNHLSDLDISTEQMYRSFENTLNLDDQLSKDIVQFENAHPLLKGSTFLCLAHNDKPNFLQEKWQLSDADFKTWFSNLDNYLFKEKIPKQWLLLLLYPKLTPNQRKIIQEHLLEEPIQSENIANISESLPQEVKNNIAKQISFDASLTDQSIGHGDKHNDKNLVTLLQEQLSNNDYFKPSLTSKELSMPTTIGNVHSWYKQLNQYFEKKYGSPIPQLIVQKISSYTNSSITDEQLNQLINEHINETYKTHKLPPVMVNGHTYRQPYTERDLVQKMYANCFYSSSINDVQNAFKLLRLIAINENKNEKHYFHLITNQWSETTAYVSGDLSCSIGTVERGLCGMVSILNDGKSWTTEWNDIFTPHRIHCIVQHIFNRFSQGRYSVSSLQDPKIFNQFRCFMDQEVLSHTELEPLYVMMQYENGAFKGTLQDILAIENIAVSSLDNIFRDTNDQLTTLANMTGYLDAKRKIMNHPKDDLLQSLIKYPKQIVLNSFVNSTYVELTKTFVCNVAFLNNDVAVLRFLIPQLNNSERDKLLVDYVKKYNDYSLLSHPVFRNNRYFQEQWCRQLDFNMLDEDALFHLIANDFFSIQSVNVLLNKPRLLFMFLSKSNGDNEAYVKRGVEYVLKSGDKEYAMLAQNYLLTHTSQLKSWGKASLGAWICEMIKDIDQRNSLQWVLSIVKFLKEDPDMFSSDILNKIDKQFTKKWTSQSIIDTMDTEANTVKQLPLKLRNRVVLEKNWFKELGSVKSLNADDVYLSFSHLLKYYKPEKSIELFYKHFFKNDFDIIQIMSSESESPTFTKYALKLALLSFHYQHEQSKSEYVETIKNLEKILNEPPNNTDQKFIDQLHTIVKKYKLNHENIQPSQTNTGNSLFAAPKELTEDGKQKVIN